MAKLRQGLEIKQQQRISPRQIEAIRLLEVPLLQLEERIKNELENNPALEEGNSLEDQGLNGEAEGDPTDSLTGEGKEEDSTDSQEEEFSYEDYVSDADDYQEGDYRENFRGNYREGEWREEQNPMRAQDFRQGLLDQLNFQRLPENKRMVAEYIVGNLDDNGYLTRPLRSLADDLFLTTGFRVRPENLQEALELVQSLEPHGVGATSLQECLLLQLRHIQGPISERAQRVLQAGYKDFSRKRFDLVQQHLKLTPEEMEEAMDLIKSLNPKPGGSQPEDATQSNQTIVPDFILEVDPMSGQIRLSLNGNSIPELRINRGYRMLLQGLEGKKEKATEQEQETAQFIKRKITSAQWFIEGIQQRNSTLLRIMECIVHFQHDYFLEGDESLVKPLTLKDISEVAGCDISTVSRAVMDKYVQTPFGIREVRDFFSQAAMTVDGEDVSIRRIKAAIVEIIEHENKQAPLTDEKLNAELNRQGYETNRRTVSKYRIELNIPVARLRREL